MYSLKILFKAVKSLIISIKLLLINLPFIVSNCVRKMFSHLEHPVLNKIDTFEVNQKRKAEKLNK